MRRRYELSTLRWERIQPLLPDLSHKGGPGRPWLPHRRLINGILWVLHTGAPWRDVPDRYGPWQTVYDRFNRWRQDGTWAKILTDSLGRLDKRGWIGRVLWMVDSSIIRGQEPARGPGKRPLGQGV